MKRRLFILLCLLPMLPACVQRTTGPSVSAAQASASATPETPTTRESPGAPPATERAESAPTMTPTPTPEMIEPGAMPTASPWPTASAPAATPPPTLAPATPAPPGSYQLWEWSPQQADVLISRLELFPNSLPSEERGFADSAYYAAFRYAALAQAEALHRFPQAVEAINWRWGLAYNYIRLGDRRGVEQYGALIQQALQSAVVTADGLDSWFAAHESRLKLSQIALDAPAGYVSAYLLELRAEQSGAFFWLLFDGQNYQVFSLSSEKDLDLAYGAGLSYDLTDVTGDGNPELVRVHAHQPGESPNFYYTDLVLYDLSQAPPQRLTFQPDPRGHLGWGERDGWTVVTSANGDTMLRIRGLVSWRCDAVEQVSNYVWRDGVFHLDEMHYEIRVDADIGGRFCLPFIYAAAEQGNEEALQYLASSAEVALAENRPVADEWRLRLAVYYALAGDVQRASEFLTDLIAQPVDAVGNWLPAAIRFRDAYETPEDLYRACEAEELCNERLALRRLVATLSPADFGIMAEHLQRWGVPMNRSRFVDLDGDGELEQWVLVNKPGAEMAVWLFLPGPQQIRAVYVDTLRRDDETFVVERMTPIESQPVVRLRTGSEERVLALEQDSSGAISVTQLRPLSNNESANYTRQIVAESQAALLSGPDQGPVQSPPEVLARLLAFQDSSAFDCHGVSSATLCADYAYTVALAYDMAGDAAGAAAAYRQLWRDYPQSPWAIVARSKLAPASADGAALTPTATPES